MSAITPEATEELRASPEGAGLTADAALGVLHLEQEFALPREQALRQVSPEPAGLGADGFHADPALRNAWLFVFRASTARTAFHVPLQELIEGGLARVCGADPPGVAPGQFLVQARSRFMEVQGAVDRVFVRLVFRGDAAAVERSQVYARLREELENRKHLLDAFFGRSVTLVIEAHSVADGAIGGQAHQRETHVYPLRVRQALAHHGPAGEVLRVGFARLADLHAMYRAMGQRFFESNIRSILGDDTPTNRSLLRAFEEILLAGTRDPVVYAFDHNGVSLFAERAEDRDGVLTLTEPRLLNGAQTVATLDRFFKEHADDPRLAARRAALDEMEVLCKVITDAGPDFILRVTLNNNRQNPVKPWNLHANDLIQLELQDKFDEELGVYYERQERAFAALAGEEDDGADAAPPEQAVELVKLARTFLAADGDVERMARLSEVFEREELYARVFRRERLGADARHILLCYKVQARLARVIREILERGEHKYAWVRRARHLVWSLLCSALLNDEGLDELARSYGTKLAVEPGYTETLTRLASARVRPLLGEVVEARYHLDIDQGRLGFLKSNALVEACLKHAAGRFGWKRRALEGRAA